MEKVKVLQVGIKEHDYKGRTYKKVGLKVQGIDEIISKAFISREDDPHLKIKEGDEIHIVITPNGQYLNFQLASRLDFLEERVKALEAFMVNGKNDRMRDGTPKEEEINTDDLGF